MVDVRSEPLDALTIAVGTIRRHVAEATPDTVEPARAAAMVGVFAEIERLGAAGKALYASRVADSGWWQRSGERSAADALAKQTGTSVGAARATLETAANALKAPEVEGALRRGELSPAQAEAIAAAAAADPSAAAHLLDLAHAGQPLAKLRDECARVRAAATDMEARQHEIHRRRSFRAWTRADGTRCGSYEMTPDAAAEIEREIKVRADAAFEAARRTDERESSEAYAADGLLDMARAARADRCADRAPSLASDARRAKQKRAEAIVIVNLESLLRGAVEGDEMCEIPGIGPVPVSVARDLLGDALLRLVIRDGHDIRTEVHAGRLASDAQRTVIQVRQRGRCARPTCHRPIDEIDHRLGFPITGATAIDELAGVCRFDHRAKTLHGHTYRRTETAQIEWILPDGTIERERPPP